ncbi:MAG: cysteine desulfurase family protein [Acutalibacteraceae bacterium]
MDCIYLDNSATTVPAKEAVEAAVYMMTQNYGNPSSLHFAGISAAEVLSEARRTVAGEMGCSESEVYFTSGGTESNNTAIFGGVHKNRHNGNKIVVSAYEHDSVINSVKALAADGYDTVFVRPRKDGKIYAEDFANACDENTIFASCMLVNNEIGAVNDVAAVFDAVRKKSPKALCHCDAVQAFGKIYCNPNAMRCDMMSVSGHKLHAPKGVGALYIRKGLRIPARTIGGGQEFKMRSGTEPMPQIAAFAAAVKLCGRKEKERNLEKVKNLRDRLYNGLKDQDVTVNSPRDCLPYIFNFSVHKIRSQVLLNFLSSKGICVSAGSACSKGNRSHVLTAMGLNPADIDSAVRVSFSRYNTENDVDALIAAVKEANSTILKR